MWKASGDALLQVLSRQDVHQVDLVLTYPGSVEKKQQKRLVGVATTHGTHQGYNNEPHAVQQSEATTSSQFHSHIHSLQAAVVAMACMQTWAGEHCKQQACLAPVAIL